MLLEAVGLESWDFPAKFRLRARLIAARAFGLCRVFRRIDQTVGGGRLSALFAFGGV
jgi:hypothetical protein